MDQPTMKLRMQGYQVRLDENEGTVISYECQVQMIPVDGVRMENASANIVINEGNLEEMTIGQIRTAAFNRFKELVANAAVA